MNVTIDLIAEVCITCGCTFGVPRERHQWLQKNPGNTYYCHNGHVQYFTGQTEAQKLAKQLAAERAAHDQTKADCARKVADLADAVAQTAKLKARVGRGVCPCCTRSFTDLRRHMATKHPEHASAAEVAAAKTRKKP